MYLEHVVVLVFIILTWLFFRGGLFFFEKTYQSWVSICGKSEESGRAVRARLYVVFLVRFVISVVLFLASAVFIEAVALGEGWTVAIVCSLIWFVAADASLDWFAKERKASRDTAEHRAN